MPGVPVKRWSGTLPRRPEQSDHGQGAQVIAFTTSELECSSKETFAVDGAAEQLNEIRAAFNKLRLWWNSLG